LQLGIFFWTLTRICGGGQVGNEFSSVEALWSQFENVMAKDEDGPRAGEAQQRQGEEQHRDDDNDDSHVEGQPAAEDEDEEMDEDITIK
jgi:DASH complex subunit DAD1